MKDVTILLVATWSQVLHLVGNESGRVAIMRLGTAKSIRLLTGPETETEEAFWRKVDEKHIRGSPGQCCSHHRKKAVKSEESSVCLKSGVNSDCR